MTVKCLTLPSEVLRPHYNAIAKRMKMVFPRCLHAMSTRLAILSSYKQDNKPANLFEGEEMWFMFGCYPYPIVAPYHTQSTVNPVRLQKQNGILYEICICLAKS